MVKLMVEVPCKIGDRMWGVRTYHGIRKPQEGIVNQIYFKKDMGLCIVLKNVCRGSYGEDIFRTEAECMRECDRRNADGNYVL